MKYVTRILIAVVILGLALALTWIGCDRQSNDYSQYEQRAWDSFHQVNSKELMPTVILSNLNCAIDLAPDRVRTDSYALRSYCWDKAGEDDKAFQDRMTFIQREPSNPKRAKVYGALAAKLAEHGEYQQAMEYVERSIELVPGNAATRATRALLYVDMGAWDKWEEELRVAIEIDSNVTNIATIPDIRNMVEKEKREQNNRLQAIDAKASQPDP
jgi:tetratricopeptide (TPR) repeat protein